MRVDPRFVFLDVCGFAAHTEAHGDQRAVNDYIGAAVNTAARLCAAAAPNQLLATAAFGATLDRHIDARPLEELTRAGTRGVCRDLRAQGCPRGPQRCRSGGGAAAPSPPSAVSSRR